MEIGTELPSKTGKEEAKAHDIPTIDIATIARDGQQANTHRAIQFRRYAP
jgi:hypothetical protein